MWTYYGTKKRIAKYYPLPQYDTIIEPFAGAAQYSLYGNNWSKKVILIDKYSIVIDVWNYLISAKESDILSLPDMYYGQSVDMHKQLLRQEKALIGFCINSASASPKKTAAEFNCWNRAKSDIASNLSKIRHWKAICADYTTAEDIAATWFIDPPYMFGGEWYAISNKHIDYVSLAQWCKERKGQIIVCENTKANWLPFQPLVDITGSTAKKTTEAIWLNSNMDGYKRTEQIDLFKM